MVLDCVFLVVLLGLALKGFGDGDDPVDVVFADLEVALLQVFISGIGATFVVLETSLVLLFRVVISHVNASKYHLRIILQILRNIMQLISLHSLYLIFHDVFLKRAMFDNLLDDLLQFSLVDHARYRLVDILTIRQHIDCSLSDHLSNASDLLQVELNVLEGHLDLFGQLFDCLLHVRFLNSEILSDQGLLYGFLDDEDEVLNRFRHAEGDHRAEGQVEGVLLPEEVYAAEDETKPEVELLLAGVVETRDEALLEAHFLDVIHEDVQIVEVFHHRSLFSDQLLDLADP